MKQRNVASIVVMVFVVFEAGLLLQLCGCSKVEPVKSVPLLCYVGGTMRPAMEELARSYEKETGQRIDIDYGDSGSCLIKIETTGKGDLYVCHDPFLSALMRKGLGDRGWVVASLTPMIAVPKGNPKNIKGLKDLARKGLRLGLTDEMYSSIGHIAPVMFEKAGLRKEIEGNVVTRMRMGGQIANAVGLGHIDAGIVWNAVIFVRKEKLDGVPIEPEYRPDPKLDAVTTATFGRIDMSYMKVTIATLKCSKQLEAARAFAEFVASPKGRAVFTSLGFSPVQEEGAARQPAPKASEALYLYCGAGIRPAVSEIVEAFTAETGTQIECDYAGSGTLLSRMKLRKSGDFYMPGDVYYVDLAEKEGLIESKKMACYFIPVILVRKGNPKKIQKLQDLIRPGIRLGLGNPEACAIGRNCEKIFKKNGINLEAVKKNVVFSSLTVNELGIQIKTGQLDATIVWDAMAAYYADCADFIPIPPAQNVISPVAIGVLRFSKNKALAQRFVDFVCGEKGKGIFKNHHYTISYSEAGPLQ